MREILFRGNRKDNGKRICGGIYHQKKDEVKDEAVYIIVGSLNDVACAYEVIPETVGQYTGLMDKNGNEYWIEIDKWASEVEVIGNIYDNPELMGGEIE